MRPAIASTLHDREVQKALVIQRVTFIYIFFNSLRGWYNGAPLKYQSWKLYNVIESIHVLYNSHLYTGERPLVEFLNIFMQLMIDNNLLV